MCTVVQKQLLNPLTQRNSLIGDNMSIVVFELGLLA